MTTTSEEANIAAAMSFVRAVEKMDGAEMEGYFGPGVEQIEMPNAFKPTGQVRDLAALKADIEKAKNIIEEQHYDIVNTVASGGTVVLEMVWHGTVATDLPGLQKGQTLRAQCVAMFEFSDGQVIKMRNYDCFDAV